MILFMAGAVFGLSLCAIVVTVYVCWDELLAFPRIWREEPDKNLRRWLVVVRRVLSPAPRPPRES